MKKKLLISLLLIALSVLFVFQIAKQSKKDKGVEPQIQSAQQTVEDTHPKNIEIPEGSEEIVEKRDTNKLVYQNPDGTFTALFTKEPIHYRTEDGTYKDIDLTFEKDGSTYVSDKNAVKTTVSNNELTVANPDKKSKITWLTDSPITVQDNIATYKDKNGNTWKYTNTVSGVKLETTIAKRQGMKTYTFPYKYDGNLTVDPSSGVITGEGFTVPLSFAKGKNGQIIYASHWIINDNSTVSFTIDDSGFPEGAFPYVLDPTTSFNAGTDDGYISCITINPSSCTVSTTPYSSSYLMVGQESRVPDGRDYRYQYYQSFISFDTSSLDDNSIIYAAYLKLYSNMISTIDQVVAATYNWSSPLSASSWRSDSQLSSLTRTSIIENPTDDTYNQFSNYGNALSSSIDKTGYTKLILYSANKLSGDFPNSGFINRFDSANYSNVPILEVVYGVYPANTMQFEGLKMEGIRAD